MSKRPRWVFFAPLVLAAAGLFVLVRVLPSVEAGPARTLGRLSPCADRPSVGQTLAARPGAFWKLASRLDASGALAGQRLQVGGDGVAVGATDLGPESTASGPVNGTILVAEDDGSASTLRLVASSSGCWASIFTTSDVVRSAILDPGDGGVIYHVVDRATRADLGTWRIGAAGALPVRLLDALPGGSLRGAVFGTALALDPTGARLAVQSCTDASCVTRLVDAKAGGAAATLADPLQGPLVGLAPNGLVTWAACGLAPCDVVLWPFDGGPSRALVHEASAAALSADGRHLVGVVEQGDTTTLEVDPLTGISRRLAGLHPGERPIAAPFAGAGLEVTRDALVVAATNSEPRSFRPADQEVQP
jgi:hypothetical protein